MACSSFVQCLSTLVLGTDTHLSMFTSQYVSTLVLSTDHSSWLVYFLVHQYCSTRYGRLITACLFAQYVSTVVLGTDNSSRHVYLLSTLVLWYSVRTTHHGSFFISLVPWYVSTSVLDTDNSSWLVYLLSTLVPLYSVRTTHCGVFYICSVPQYVSTLVLGRDTLLQLVLHLFSALVRYYLSTRNRHSPQHVYLLSTLVLQYSIRTTHHGSFFISLVPWYVSTSVLDTDNSSWLVYLLSTLVPLYSVRTTHCGVFYICSVPQYVSTLVLGRDTLLQLVLHLFSALVRYYLSTRNRHSPRHVYLLSTLHRKKHLIPKLGISKKFPKLNPNNGYYMGICMKFPK